MSRLESVINPTLISAAGELNIIATQLFSVLQSAARVLVNLRCYLRYSSIQCVDDYDYTTMKGSPSMCSSINHKNIPKANKLKFLIYILVIYNVH